MDNKSLAQTYRDIFLKETDELLEIWQNGNYDEWEEDAISIISEILKERLGYLPPISIKRQVLQILKNVESHFKTGDFNVALSECALAIEMMPDYAISYVYQGQIYDGMGDLEKAINAFQTAIQIDPKSKVAWENLNIIEDAIEREFIHSTTKQHLDHAIDYASKNESDKVMEECELARATMPNIAFAYNYLGRVLEKSGQLEPAIGAYLKALQLNPRFNAAQENLKYARYMLKDEIFHQALLENNGEENEFIADFDESNLSEIPEDDYPTPVWLYLDETSYFLPGWPGHRNLPGRIGFDPLANDFELSHMQGVMIRLLMTCKFRTHNPFYLFLMIFVGVIFCTPLIFGGHLLVQDLFSAIYLILYCPYWIVGISLLINAILSLLPEKPNERDDYGYAFF
jgi:tetratricopeptide (TPR) repeat protein